MASGDMRRLPRWYKNLRGEKQAIERGLPAVIKLGGAAGFLVDWVVYVAEGLLEQDGRLPFLFLWMREVLSGGGRIGASWGGGRDRLMARGERCACFTEVSKPAVKNPTPQESAWGWEQGISPRTRFMFDVFVFHGFFVGAFVGAVVGGRSLISFWARRNSRRLARCCLRQSTLV